MVRVRIAPSPTGENLHIGNVYAALLNFSFAKKNNGKFIVRIEDTDRTRLVAGSEEKILSSLKWFGLLYDEGPDVGGPYEPYRQSERKEIYRKYAEELIEKGHAFYCFCTEERLAEMREQQKKHKQQMIYDGCCKKYTPEEAKEKAKTQKHVIRLNVPEKGVTEFKDIIRGKISFENKLIDDQVLLKSDGFPTYHLGVVVDDHLMEITHIIRAEEWISSAPKHVLLYTFFKWELPFFAHIPILRNPDRSKLSKRKNPVWVSWYQEQGFLPEAILNYLALMGWSHPQEKEIFSLDEFIRLFRLEDVKPVGPIFDIEKLKWVNGMYLRNMSVKELSEKLQTFHPAYKKINAEIFEKIVSLAQTRINTLKEFENLAGHFLTEPHMSLSNQEKTIAKNVQSKFQNISSWNKETILEVLREILKVHKVKMNVLYIILTGQERGLPLPESLEILGKEKTIKRLQPA